MAENDDSNNLDMATAIPMIDGGTEGFKGQARVILPRISACFECAIETFPPQKTYPICTLASTPRIPEHCIQWASIVHWDEIKPFGVDGQGKASKIDTDNPEHMKWLFERASERAAANNISGVTYKLTQGVVKNIIPAIASTNAIVAAACTHEAFKLATNIASPLNNYLMYMGNNGLYTHTFEYAKKETCPVCGNIPVTFAVRPDLKLRDFMEQLREDPRFQLKKPTIRADNRNIFMQAPPQLHERTLPNLEKTMIELFAEGTTLDCTDPALGEGSLQIVIKFK